MTVPHSSTFLTDITGFYGRRGSGKTTLALTLAKAANPPRIAVIDPVDIERRGVPFQKACHQLEAGQNVYCSDPNPDALREFLFCVALKSTREAPWYVICDEAPMYLGTMSAGLQKISFQGRHAGLGMAIVTQRPAAIPPDFRENMSGHYFMALSGENNLKTATTILGTDRAKALASLPVGGFDYQAT